MPRFVVAFQASLRGAASSMHTHPALETPGYCQTVPPGPASVEAGRYSDRKSERSDREVPEGSLRIARQWNWRDCATQEKQPCPVGLLSDGPSGTCGAGEA